MNQGSVYRCTHALPAKCCAEHHAAKSMQAITHSSVTTTAQCQHQGSAHTVGSGPLHSLAGQQVLKPWMQTKTETPVHKGMHTAHIPAHCTDVSFWANSPSPVRSTITCGNSDTHVFYTLFPVAYTPNPAFKTRQSLAAQVTHVTEPHQ